MAADQVRKEWVCRRAKRRSEQAVGCGEGHGGRCEMRLGLKKGLEGCVEDVAKLCKLEESVIISGLLKDHAVARWKKGATLDFETGHDGEGPGE